MKYKLSRKNDKLNFCSEYKGIYLIEDKDGKSLYELSDTLYELLIMIKTWSDLMCVIEK